MIIRELQERVARALPAEHVEIHDGWWLRRSASASWWLSTVLPHGDGDLAAMVEVAERFGATRFQITPGACPSELDGLLADRGYLLEYPTSLRTAKTAEVPDSSDVDVRVDSVARAEWFECWYALHGLGGSVEVERAMLDRVGPPSGFASVMDRGRVIAVGRAVAEDGWAGLFGMGTLPEARGKGAGRAVLGALAGWALNQAAEEMYLQVEAGNAAAIRLYDQAGFTELATYHYRRRA
ncbi:GNAT family N-acetyltransferase [Pseudonocardiaceae bacterium YIM PH 21723]|nr:GNAT family N-acetyltransferase [Pseudonocardiaceae bacterium YIM PH 21723]